MTFPSKLRFIANMKMVHNAAKNNKEKEYEAIIVQLKVKIKDQDDIKIYFNIRLTLKWRSRRHPKLPIPNL